LANVFAKEPKIPSIRATDTFKGFLNSMNKRMCAYLLEWNGDQQLRLQL